MQAILAGGLSEATMECLNNLINDYELWHDALAVKIPDAQRAFAYKKLVVGLSERISNQMEHKINYIETRSLMKGINLAQTDPIALLTKAANIVLNDSENLEAIKAIESGRAFNVGGGFDPRKRPPPGGHSEHTGPTEWLQDMSLRYAMCARPARRTRSDGIFIACASMPRRRS